MKLIVDMNLTPRWVAYLSKENWEVRHWSSVGDPKAPDSIIMQWARDHGFIVLTNDLDFPQILAHMRAAAPSIILLRGEPLTPEARGDKIVLLLRQCESEIGRGAIVSVDCGDGFRVRLLPLA